MGEISGQGTIEVDARGHESERQRSLRRSNVRLALVIGVVALGFYLLMFLTGWFRW